MSGLKIIDGTPTAISKYLEENKSESKEIAYDRIVEIINLVDSGKLTNEQAIKKIMKTITKQYKREYKK
jgi:predicted transcriptional regulator